MIRRAWKTGIGLSVCALSTMAIMAGCNDDDDDGGPVVPTPTATASPTASPTTPGTQNFSVPVTLSNRQNGTMNLRVQGSQVTGTLTVRAASAQSALNTRVFTFVIPAGTYNITGTFTLPRTFRVSGVFPAPIGNFVINGLIPTPTQNGSYIVSAGGQTANGTIPALNTNPTPTASPTGTATATPTATVTPGPGSGTTNLIFTPGSGYNGLTAPFNRVDAVLSASLFNNSGAQASTLTGALQMGGTQSTVGQPARTLNLSAFTSGSLIAVGTTFSTGVQGNFQVRYGESRQGTTPFSGTWSSSSGTVRVEALTDNRITLRFTNFRFDPFPFGSGQGRGTFTMNGPLTFAISRVMV
jgi:hypothetical protein